MKRSIVFFCVGIVIAGTLEATFAPGGPAPGRRGQAGMRKIERRHQQGLPQAQSQKKDLEVIVPAYNLEEFTRKALSPFIPVVVKFYRASVPSSKNMTVDKNVARQFGQEDTITGFSGPEIRVWKATVQFIMVDMDVNIETANKYNTTKVPTYVFFKNGKEKIRHEGVLGRAAYMQKVKQLQGM